MRKLLFTFVACIGLCLSGFTQDSALSVQWDTEDSFQLVLNKPMPGAKKGAVEISRDGLNPVFYREVELSMDKPLLATTSNRFNKGSYIIKLKARGLVYETSLLID